MVQLHLEVVVAVEGDLRAGPDGVRHLHVSDTDSRRACTSDRDRWNNLNHKKGLIYNLNLISTNVSFHRRLSHVLKTPLKTTI